MESTPPLISKMERGELASHECDECGNRYEYKRGLQRHMNAKHNAKHKPCYRYASIQPKLHKRQHQEEEQQQQQQQPQPQQPPQQKRQKQQPQQKQQQHDRCDDIDMDVPTVIKEVKNKQTVPVEMPTCPCHDPREKFQRLESIVTDFFWYRNDPKVQSRLVDTNAMFLIQHSRICQESDKTLLECYMGECDQLAQDDRLHRHTIYEVMMEFCETVKEESGGFTWGALVVVFTLSHTILMNYPHQYPEIVSGLIDIFHVLQDEMTPLGEWDGFIQYARGQLQKKTKL